MLNFNLFKSLLFFLCLVCGLSTAGQELKFTHIDADDGLSQSVVNCIMQDSKGFMWFGTDDGLNKYDGNSIVVYKKIIGDSTSLSHNGILCLFVDSRKTLWLGTNGGGLNKYNKLTESFERYQHHDGSPKTISNNIVRDIFEDDKGNLWIATDAGLNLLDRKSRTFTHFSVASGLQNEKIRSIFQADDGLLWLGTYGGGLHSFDRESQTFTQYIDLKNQQHSDSVRRNRIRTVFIDSKDRMWLGTHGASLALFERQTKKFTYFNLLEEESSVITTKIFEDESGKLWVGTKSALFSFDEEKNAFIPYHSIENDPFSLSANSINDIYQDRAGSIWIGTNGGGLSVYHSTLNRFGHYNKAPNAPNTLPNSRIYNFAEDNEKNLWIASYGAGLVKFNRKTHQFTDYPRGVNLTLDNVLSLFMDTDGLLWFGTHGGGANYYNTKTKTFGPHFERENNNENSLCNNNVMCIRQDKNGLIWLATFNGLSTYNKATKTFRKYSTDDGLSSNFIYTLHFDKNDNLWLGTADGGLNMLDTKTGNVIVYAEKKDLSGISNNTVNCIFEGKDGIFWLGTAMGLNRFDSNSGEFKHFYEKDGLPNDYIYGILQDEKDNLWLSTNKGLSRFNPNTVVYDPNLFRNFTVSDGLQAQEFNQGAFYKSQSGEMLFGGINGFNAFYPNQIIDNTNIPSVYATSFKVYGKEIKLDTAITTKKYIELDYKQNFLSFEFVGLDYVLPEKNKYSWKLEGLEDSWTPVSTRRYANYTDLKGGDYVFKVRASNNDGIWNEEGAAIHIRINPPFWQTNWFLTLCIVTGILLLLLFIQLRTRQIQREKKVLEEKVAQRTKELAEKNKDIMDSIQYAQKIQEAILPNKNIIYEHLNAFILYLPKDIVSGDFYWFYKKAEKIIIATVDCTGHGVPGAFMSMIGNNLLNQIVIENGITKPAKILTELNNGVQTALNQRHVDAEASDGMDVALCTIDKEKNELEFAGALRPLYIIKKGNIEKIEGVKSPIGGLQLGAENVYTSTVRQLAKGDTFYMFSDGYADQFGGKKGKKFMAKRLQQLLLDMQELPMGKQKKTLKIPTWIGKAMASRWMIFY